jgi:anti-sigma regulatory factor (Ser/Thr protein kinase)
MGLPGEIVRRVSIAAYEGEINAVIHAGGGKITVTAAPEAVTVVIADTGQGIGDIDLAMKEGFTTATDSIRSLGFGAGMGLPNMKKYADEFGIHSEVGKGTTITMKIHSGL